MTEAELAAIEARANAAMPGPWEVDDERSESDGGPGEDGWGVWAALRLATVHVWRPSGNGSDEADFIAHAREDIPALVAEVRRLRATLERLPAVLDEIHNSTCWGNQECCGFPREHEMVVIKLKLGM